MKLEEFKEKLFKKANGMSVRMDYSGSTYQVIYNDRYKDMSVSATAVFNPENELLYIRLGVCDSNDDCYGVTYFPYIDDSDEFDEFLEQVERNGYLD